MILTKISLGNEFILVIVSDRNVRSSTKSGRTLNGHNVKEERDHSGTELDTWIVWVDDLQ